MKNLFLATALLTSIHSFAGTTLDCSVTQSTGELKGASTAIVKFYKGRNVVIKFFGSELTKVRIKAQKVKETKDFLKVTRNGPDAEKRVFTMKKTKYKIDQKVEVILKDNTLLGWWGDEYASVQMNCDEHTK